jgi:hypothetical protein
MKLAIQTPPIVTQSRDSIHRSKKYFEQKLQRKMCTTLFPQVLRILRKSNAGAFRIRKLQQQEQAKIVTLCLPFLISLFQHGEKFRYEIVLPSLLSCLSRQSFQYDSMHADESGFDSRHDIFLFFTESRRAMGSTRPTIQIGGKGFSPGVKRPGREASGILYSVRISTIVGRNMGWSMNSKQNTCKRS